MFRCTNIPDSLKQKIKVIARGKDGRRPPVLLLMFAQKFLIPIIGQSLFIFLDFFSAANYPLKFFLAHQSRMLTFPRWCLSTIVRKYINQRAAFYLLYLAYGERDYTKCTSLKDLFWMCFLWYVLIP